MAGGRQQGGGQSAGCSPEHLVLEDEEAEDRAKIRCGLGVGGPCRGLAVSWPGGLALLSATVGIIDQCSQDADVGTGEDAFSVEVGRPGFATFDQGALEPLVDQHLVARGGALWFGEFDLCLLIANRGGEHELFHPSKVGQRLRKVKGRKGEFLGSVWVFVERVWGGN